MKFCTKCGKQLDDLAVFCPACGSRQAESAVPVETTPQAAQPVPPAPSPEPAPPVIEPEVDAAAETVDLTEREKYREYYGKTCPFCKTVITESDEIEVCPACGIAHHKSCWEENGGCTTFGCSGKAPGTVVCYVCGADVAPEQRFCPKCGAPRVQEPAAVPAETVPERPTECPNCGASLLERMEYCGSCGCRVAPAQPDVVPPTAVPGNTAAKKKNRFKALAAVLAVLALVITGAVVLPKLMKSPDDYLAEANYIKAYEKAKSSEKSDVLAENLIAYCSEQCAKDLIKKSSFKLTNAWFDSSEKNVVLEVSAYSKDGDRVTNWWLYSYDDDSMKWEFERALTGLYERTIYYYSDDTETIIDKYLDNSALETVQQTMTASNKVSSESIDRINTLFQDGLLVSVSLLPGAEHFN